jgi:hypothetical protein
MNTSSIVSEKTYAMRLHNSYTILAVMQSAPNYTTDQAELLPANFATFLQQVANDNKAHTIAEFDYQTAVANRRLFFAKNENSIHNTVISVKIAVLARYGKDTTQYKSISSIVKKMTYQRPSIKTKPDSQNPDNTITTITSRSQRSYASITENFKNLVTVLLSFQNYDSPRQELKLPALQAQLLAAEQHNNNTDTTYFLYKKAQALRQENYAVLFERASKIKAFLLSIYGKQSSLYRQVAKLSI